MRAEALKYAPLAAHERTLPSRCRASCCDPRLLAPSSEHLTARTVRRTRLPARLPTQQTLQRDKPTFVRMHPVVPPEWTRIPRLCSIRVLLAEPRQPLRVVLAHVPWHFTMDDVGKALERTLLEEGRPLKGDSILCALPGHVSEEKTVHRALDPKRKKEAMTRSKAVTMGSQ